MLVAARTCRHTGPRTICRRRASASSRTAS
jgi:hypothetical protein